MQLIPKERKNNMRLKTLLTLLMGITLFCNNVLGTDYRATYDFEFTKDSINSIEGIEFLF